MESSSMTFLFDFGPSPAAEGYQSLAPEEWYEPNRGYGWLSGHALRADRIDAPDPLRSTYLESEAEARLRIDLRPGRYRISVLVGDRRIGSHALSFSVRNGDFYTFPTVRPGIPHRQFTLIGDVEIAEGETELVFSSPVRFWVVNSLRIESVRELRPSHIVEEQVWVPYWPDFDSWPDPPGAHRERFLARLKSLPPIDPSGLNESVYLSIIEGVVLYFLKFQKTNGAITDPFQNEELQYSTPAFALAAATLAVHGNKDNFLEPAASALDHATCVLRQAAAHHRHEDFYPPLVAHACRLLRDRVTSERVKTWRNRIRSYDPHRTYRFGQGGGNWNVVALSGEALYELFGLRDGIAYAEDALERQAYRFTRWGMYLDVNSEAMAYDQFPRLWLADMLGNGYEGRLAKGLRTFLERGAWTSLFTQSPAGEMPTGGRSAHHQWNEAAQCVTFEVFARLARSDGDKELAGVFKRAARLSLASIKQWIRPSGDLWIVKNRLDPEKRHGYESYSFHSQYNLLPMAMLAIAYQHGLETAEISERPAPAETGGFVIQLDEDFHKIFANAAGTYVQLDTGGIPAYDPTGLVRIHFLGSHPQLGPSDGLVRRVAGTTAAVGIAWRDRAGRWHRLAEYQKGQCPSSAVEVFEAGPQTVRFRVSYHGDFESAGALHENYHLTPGHLEIQWQVEDYQGPLRLVWPVLAHDGANETELTLRDRSLCVSLNEHAQRYNAPEARSVRIGTKRYAFRNGWARLATAEFGNGVRPTLQVSPVRPSMNPK